MATKKGKQVAENSPWVVWRRDPFRADTVDAPDGHTARVKAGLAWGVDPATLEVEPKAGFEPRKRVSKPVPMPAKTAPKPEEKPSPKYTVVCQEWEEHERGWGVRPDGCTLHLSESDRVAYCKEFWERMHEYDKGGGVPDEYTCESGRPTLIEVGQAIYDKVKASKNGVGMYGQEYYDLQKSLKS